MGKCTCFEDTLARVTDHVAKGIGEKYQDLKVSWQNEAFILSAADYLPVNPKILVEYRTFKKDDTPRKNLTKKDFSMFCTYCPFCGRKLEKEGEAPEPSPSMKKLQETCDKNQGWQTALEGVSKGYTDYNDYCDWVRDAWPEFAPANVHEYDVIMEMYKAG